MNEAQHEVAARLAASGAQDALRGMAGAGTCRSSMKHGRTPAAVDVHSPGVPLARMIDHTLLKPQAAEADIRRLCREAVP